jgi:hypothetical protein
MRQNRQLSLVPSLMVRSRYRPAVDGEAWDELLAALAGWSADERVREAARSRARRRSLGHQAAESATFAGVLLDLAERRASVTITTVGGRHDGQLVAAATGICVVRSAAGEAALIALPAITHVTTGPVLAIGERTPPLELDLAGALAAMAADRPTVRLELVGGERVAGVLDTVGTDLVSLHSNGEPRQTALIALDAVSACLL